MKGGGRRAEDFFCVVFWGTLPPCGTGCPQTPGSTFPSVELEKSREKNPLKKFFSHTFRLLIYGEQPHPPTPSPNREGEKVPLCEERDLGWGCFNAIWQMKNFWLTPFLFLWFITPTSFTPEFSEGKQSSSPYQGRNFLSDRRGGPPLKRGWRGFLLIWELPDGIWVRICLQQSDEWKNFGWCLFYWIIIYYLYLLFV